jgi:uncharacterized protein YbaP (TraB family)
MLSSRISGLSACAVALGLALTACSPPAARVAVAAPEPAVAATPAASLKLSDEWLPPKEKGLPMWVVRDEDSTIYLTGTVHALPPGTPWKSPKLEDALKQADEVWLEIAMTDRADLQRRSGEVMQKYAAASKPLSSLLNEKERAALAEFAHAMKMTPAQGKRLDGLKPWAVTNAISASSMTSTGFDSEAGIDWEIARTATKLGHKVNGFETIDFQASVLSAESEADQLRQLRMMLAMPRETRERMFSMMFPSFVAWANGDTRPMTAFFTFTSLVSNFDAKQKAQLDRLLVNRNRNWADKLEERLKGSGVSFVAVGGGHLIGPNNLRALLEARGIHVERY